MSLKARPWLSVLYELGRMGILKSWSVLEDRSRDNRRSQDIISDKRMCCTLQRVHGLFYAPWVFGVVGERWAGCLLLLRRLAAVAKDFDCASKLDFVYRISDPRSNRVHRHGPRVLPTLVINLEEMHGISIWSNL